MSNDNTRVSDIVTAFFIIAAICAGIMVVGWIGYSFYQAHREAQETHARVDSILYGK